MTTQLTNEDKALLNTNFGEEIEKIAAQRATAINEAYAYGFSKIAKEAADEKDKEDKENEGKDNDKKEEKMDEESEKAAAELGAFIERGFFDGLRKLGSERHGDEMHYIAPFILEKAAAAGAREMGAAVMSKLKGAAGVVSSKAKDAAHAIDPRRGIEEIRRGVKGGTRLHGTEQGVDIITATPGMRAKEIATGAARLSPYAALGTAGIYGGAKLVGGSDKAQ